MEDKFLFNLLSTPTVSGCEEAGQALAEAYCASFAEQMQTDDMGNFIAAVNPKAPFRVLLCGHMDEIGFRVTHIDERGFLHVQRAGGVRPKLYLGAPMQVLHEAGGRLRRVPGVGAVSSGLLKKEDVEDTDLLIDIGASSRDEAASLVSVGDPVCADVAPRQLAGTRVACRALDDKTGVAVVMNALRRAKEMGASCGIYAAATVGEETSGRGAYAAAARVKPDCAIIVDVTWASDSPGGDPASTGEVRLGHGPVLCLSGMVNKAMNRLLEEIAGLLSIPVQYEVAGGRTATDGDTVLKTGAGLPMALVSIPLRYMHSSAEVADLSDIEACAELIAAFLTRIGEGFDFRPALK